MRFDIFKNYFTSIYILSVYLKGCIMGLEFHVTVCSCVSSPKVLINRNLLLAVYSRRWEQAVAQFVKALRYKPEGRGFDSRLGHQDFSLT